MSKPRVDLQSELEKVMGSPNVYFQPPPTFMIKYPCIIYNLNNDKVHYAGNDRYKEMNRYTVLLIDKNPDSQFLVRIKRLPYCSFDRSYTMDNLNHYSFTIFY